MAEDARPQEPENKPIGQPRQEAGDVFGVILGSLERLEGAVGRVDHKVDRQTGRMDTLVDATNHRLDEFREFMSEEQEKAQAYRAELSQAFFSHQQVVATAISSKADRTELLTSLGVKLLNLSPIRWAIGVIGLTLLTSLAATYQHWGRAVIHGFSQLF